MREKLMRLMYGRYGMDQFGRFLIGVAMILMLLSILGPNIFYTLAVVVMVYAYFRMFSKQTYKRAGENQKYLQYEWKVKNWFGKKKREIKQLKTHHIYKCPNCKQKIRVPRGRGKIAITCKKCSHEFVKKS
ncbi:MAG: hypothetical protein IJN16_01355 [Lachnospiraceae bacterium]|nr:hypothetical protein [Lachnospiraceae bacterium]